MHNKFEKVKKYVCGIGIRYLFYGLKYKFYNTSDNYARIKYGKQRFLYKALKKNIKRYNNVSKNGKLRYYDEKVKLEKFPVWVCWFQGLDNAPEIVKICIESIKNNISLDSELHILTDKNIEEFIEIPNIIQDKLKKGKISKTIFSDFIRVAILSKYGGFWIDSTVLVTENITNLCNYDFYTKKSDRIENNFGNYLVQGRFAIHLLKCDSSNILINFLYDSFLIYYKKYDVPIDYFMTNLIVDLGYQNIDAIKKDIDTLKINDSGLEGRMCEYLNEPFNDDLYKQFLNNMPFQKLSYKLPEFLIKKYGKLTFYGYIKEKFYDGEKK